LIKERLVGNALDLLPDFADAGYFAGGFSSAMKSAMASGVRKDGAHTVVGELTSQRQG
jgi:hypothetical protein